MQFNTLVLIDFIVSFGSILVQSTDLTRTEVHPVIALVRIMLIAIGVRFSDPYNNELLFLDGRQFPVKRTIEVKFKKTLFDSIVNNDPRKIGSYRNILQNEASREQQAFNIFKEEFGFMRQKNTHKHQTFHKHDGKGEKVSAFKREIFSANNDGSPYVVRKPKSDRSEERLAQSLLDKWKENPKNPRALYDTLKRRSDTFLNISNLRVTGEDLTAKRMFSSDVGPEISLHYYGYLSVISGRKTPGDLYTLGFSDLRTEVSLYVDLITEAGATDKAVEEALFTMETVIDEIPPKVDQVKSFMRALDTVINSVPLRYEDWQRPAITAALLMCGLNVTNGNTKQNERIIFCENFTKDTRFLFVVDDRFANAIMSWGKYYYDVVREELRSQVPANLLVLLTINSNGRNSSGIHDWFGLFRPENKNGPRREYRP